jgi:peptidoglycan/LPS O-acetylase OafA/YrhL
VSTVDNPVPRLADGRIPSLDGLRALAISGVLASKAAHTPGFPEMHWLRRIADQGTVGVDLFFVISGFLITTLLIGERARTGTVSLTGFYTRRALRILPAYVVLLWALFGLSLHERVSLAPVDWWTALTYTVNFAPVSSWDVGHIWSLSVEEHFYMVWPCVALWCSTRALGLWALAGCLVPPILRGIVVLGFPDWSSTTELWTPYRCDTIAWGCLLATAVQEPVWRARLERIVAGMWWWVVPLGVLAVACRMSSFTKFGLIPGYTIKAMCLAWLAWGAVRRHEQWFTRVLNAPLLVNVGVLSYSLYLWHRVFLRPDSAGAWLAFPWNLIPVFVAAWLSWAVVETPFLAWKDHLAKKRARKRRPENRRPGRDKLSEPREAELVTT